MACLVANLVAGLVAGGQPALAAGPVPVRAQGHEPEWQVRIEAGQLRLRDLQGEQHWPAPRPRSVPGGTRHAVPSGPELMLRPGLCTDTMTGQPHPQRATLRWQGRTLQGCAGDPATLLTGPAWQVQAIDGQPLPAGVLPTLQFGAEGTLSGSSGCNSFRTPWVLTGEGLSLGVVASTRRACLSETQDSEDRLFALLPQVQRFEIAADGALLLHGPPGRSLRATRR